jgi:hypothetical protein
MAMHYHDIAVDYMVGAQWVGILWFILPKADFIVLGMVYIFIVIEAEFHLATNLTIFNIQE